MLKHRSSLQKILCPVVICPYLLALNFRVFPFIRIPGKSPTHLRVTLNAAGLARAPAVSEQGPINVCVYIYIYIHIYIYIYRERERESSKTSELTWVLMMEALPRLSGRV